MGARNVWRLLQEALVAAENADLAAGQNFSIVPIVNDQGAFIFGNGTKDLDVKVFLGGDGSNVLFDSGNKVVTLTGVTLAPAGAGGTRPKVNDLTANTTLNSTHLNGFVTNRGAAGAVVLTLPDAATVGDWVAYRGVADQNVTIKTATADTLIALNDAAADSLAFSTANSKIGTAADFVYDGSAWHAVPIYGTATIAT